MAKPYTEAAALSAIRAAIFFRTHALLTCLIIARENDFIWEIPCCKQILRHHENVSQINCNISN